MKVWGDEEWRGGEGGVVSSSSSWGLLSWLTTYVRIFRPSDYMFRLPLGTSLGLWGTDYTIDVVVYMGIGGSVNLSRLYRYILEGRKIYVGKYSQVACLALKCLSPVLPRHVA